MENEKDFTFEEIFNQNEKRIYYYIHLLGLQDPHREYYVEGIYAMWMAYKKYEPDKGPLSTYFNYTIKNRLLDMLRKKEREHHQDEIISQEEKVKVDNGNRLVKKSVPLVEHTEISMKEEGMFAELQDIQDVLTENQFKWFTEYIVKGERFADIAAREGVTINAVKSWGRQARKKLRELEIEW